MNSRERVRAALTCRRPDRPPVALAFFPQDVPAIAPAAAEDYFGLDIRYVEFGAPPEQAPFLSYLGSLPRDVHVGDLRQLRTYHEWGYHPEAGPLGPLGAVHSLADLERHTFPDLRDPARYAGLAEQAAAWHARGCPVAGSPPHLGGELFETAYRLRGFENFLADLAIHKPLAHYLLDQLQGLLVHSALVLARAGVDILLLDDDVAMPTGLLLSLATWREFFKPRLAEVIRLARQAAPADGPDLLVLYHSDGDFTALVPDLVEIGVNAINPVQPDCMDALAIKRAFGDRLALWGTVGTAALWDNGTSEEVREEVRKRVAELGPEGLLLAPAYDIDFTPLENLEAFVQAAKAAGSQV